MKKLGLRALVLAIVSLCGTIGASAELFNLDSVAAWGRFPKFCVDTYRWGDRFFNSYDTLYVVGSGYKFNGKIVTDSWLNYYHFQLPDGRPMDMMSDPSTSLGAYLTYLAVSVGYDVNVKKLFGGEGRVRNRYQFGFDCALLSVEMYWMDDKVGTRLRRFGGLKGINIPFNDVSVGSYGVDVYYFFNHKRYSQPAGFGYSRIQRRSQGSFYAGLSYYSQKFDFDFSGLPSYLLESLKDFWHDTHYKVQTKNYGFRLGYGYNWVFRPNWVWANSFSPTVGVATGYINSDTEDTNMSLYLRMKSSLVWNHGEWFVGVIGKVNTAIISSRKTVFTGNEMSIQAAVGYRFNLW